MAMKKGSRMIDVDIRLAEVARYLKKFPKATLKEQATAFGYSWESASTDRQILRLAGQIPQDVTWRGWRENAAAQRVLKLLQQSGTIDKIDCEQLAKKARCSCKLVWIVARALRLARYGGMDVNLLKAERDFYIRMVDDNRGWRAKTLNFKLWRERWSKAGGAGLKLPADEFARYRECWLLRQEGKRWTRNGPETIREGRHYAPFKRNEF